MWFLWKSRCLKLFEGKIQYPTVIIQQNFQFFYSHRICVHNSCGSHSYASTHIVTNPRNFWTPPPYDWLKLNFDVFILPDSNFVGFSLVLRNHLGEFLEVVAWKRNVRDIDQAEVLVVLRVLQWINFKGLCRIKVEGDNKSVMEAVKKQQNESIRWEDQLVMSESISLSQALVDVHFRFVNGSYNKAVYALAKFARSNNYTNRWDMNPPECILPFLQQEVVFQKD
ncbi:hypothetical protein MKX03_022489 [Papaver bracteatum]|nr:hypothetical protein MKX03_022489 [Papaver bracteatum]